MVEQQKDFSNLDSFNSNKFFKASLLGDNREDWVFVVLTDIKEKIGDKGQTSKIPVLFVEYNKITYEWELNKRNRDSLKELKWSEKWQQLVGHKILVQKIPTQKPDKTPAIGLNIWKVE